MEAVRGKERNPRTGLIVYSDAAQSGSQIISTITDDLSLQNAVNINLKTGLFEKTNDYYLSVLDFIKENWEEMVEDEKVLEKMTKLGNAYTKKRQNPVEKDEVGEIVARMTRSFVKKNVMTVAYNLTLYGAGEQLMEELGQEISPREAGIVAVLTRAAVEKVFPRVYEFLAVCKNSVKTFTDGGVSPRIVTPFVNSNVNMRKNETITVNGNPIVVEGSEPHTLKMAQSHAPNVIHSIDASIVHTAQMLATLVIRDGERMPMITIHDSFGTTPRFVRNLPVVQRIATVIALDMSGEFLKVMLPSAPEEWVSGGASQGELDAYVKKMI